MRSFRWLPRVRHLWIAADNDEVGRGPPRPCSRGHCVRACRLISNSPLGGRTTSTICS
jgi:hypothetical protein